ncbi:MAG: aminomethyl-transferring glycine dehydrogenase subunit GcvPB [bacterium JZ-2024 1]
MTEKTIFEKSRRGRVGFSLPESPFPPVPEEKKPKFIRKHPLSLPQVSEPEVVRHFVRLSHKNASIEEKFYPLGSCTMKYNPRLNISLAQHPYVLSSHPLQPDSLSQGILKLWWAMEEFLKEIFGVEAVSLLPAAGAHGELTGLWIIRKYFEEKGESGRRIVLVPDSAHGTNPASAAMAGFSVQHIPSNARGQVDIESLQKACTQKVAALMLTNPNTLGLFESEILKIAQICHDAGVQLYYDGANANAILGISRPGDMGFDVVHINIHKTFATPHGGGGPGAGPVGVKKHLEPYLPIPRLIQTGPDAFALSEDYPLSIGRLRFFHGNVGVWLQGLAYISLLGAEGLKRVAYLSCLNANYLLARLKSAYSVPYPYVCKHEFVLSAENLRQATGIRALDVAKRLMDFGFHPPTIYFPLIVKEALMIEPTETESKETLDAFAEAMLQIAREAKENPSLLTSAPHYQPIGRPDEARAARKPDVASLSD